jgi:probable rRNA maturation factor
MIKGIRKYILDRLRVEINVLIEDGIEIEISVEWLQWILETVLNAEKAPANSEISLIITGQERIQQLNREYRGKDKPTDVLSFSMTEQKENEDDVEFVSPPDGLMHLGEIIISYPQAKIQALEHKHSLQKEMAILVVHGTLHILGYDHEKAEMEPAMTAREKEILPGFCEGL